MKNIEKPPERLTLNPVVLRPAGEGQQRRVAIAWVLANQPRLILADEPTGNLDAQTRLNREQGIMLILATHEADIAHYAHRLVCFKDGRIVHDGAMV